jgi:hypothetical protein
MPLSIKIEDFKEEVIAEHFDQKGLLNEVLNYCYKNPLQTRVFKYIDLYDDTVLNSLQIKDFIVDIEFLQNQSHLMSKERIELFSELIKLSKIALEEPHQYLIFYGD